MIPIVPASVGGITPPSLGTLGAWFQAYDNSHMAVNIDGSGGVPADGGLVGRWLDLTNNANHVSSSANDVTRPMWRAGNGLNFRALNAVAANYSTMRNTSTTAMPRQNSSGAMLCQVPGTLNSISVVDFGTTGNGYAIMLSASQVSGPRIQVHDGGGFQTPTPVIFTNLRRSVILWRSNGTTCSIRVNGVEGSMTIGGTAVNMTNIFFGTFAGGIPKPIRIFEAIFYANDIGDSKLALLEAYLRGKAGVGIGDPTKTVVTVCDSLSAATGSATCQPWSDYVTNRSGSVWYSASGEGDPFEADTSYNDINTIKGSNENLVVIWGGTNDILINSRTGAQVEGYIKTFINGLTGTKKIVVCTLPDFAPSPVARTDLNTLLRANYTTYVSGPSTIALADLAANANLSDHTNLTYYNADGVHHTDAGYVIDAGIIQTAMALL